MGDNIYVPVKAVNPTTPANSVTNASNCIQVSVNYWKGRGITASAYPAESKPSGSVMVLVTSGAAVKLEDAARLNRKRVDACLQAASEQIAAKAGPVWDLVLTVCGTSGLRPVIHPQGNSHARDVLGHGDQA